MGRGTYGPTARSGATGRAIPQPVGRADGFRDHPNDHFPSDAMSGVAADQLPRSRYMA